MNELHLKLKNCYGISKMSCDIDFKENNVAIFYAPNGTMKSSLAKTFEDIHEQREPKERVYSLKSEYEIRDENRKDILPENILVINPFEENAYENQGLLMANNKLRKQYLNIHKGIDSKKIELFKGIKEILKYTSRNKFDVEGTLLNDFEFNGKNIFDCLENIKKLFNDIEMECKLEDDDLDYKSLFNEKVYKLIKTEQTSELINEYEKRYNELIEKSLYMRKGIIDHNNYSNINEALNTNGFFKASNEVILNAKDKSKSLNIKSKKELENLIKSEKERVLNSEEIKDVFEKINKALCANKETKAFNNYLQKHKDIVIEYKDIDKFKKKVWIKAFKKYEYELTDLLNEYYKAKKSLQDLNEQAKKETTVWDKALETFKERFFVPFTIEPSNQPDVILKDDMPSFKYIFKGDNGEVEIEKNQLLSLLSTGERRAYYILNFVFQVIACKLNNKETVIILDDISESFDYKNKYAIIEYINDISKITNSNGNKLFNIILLTHNFDFYRTIASRITGRKNSFIAYKDNNEIKLKQGQYIKNVFGYFKQQIKTKNKFIVASIPFVRNLIEYTVGEDNQDYLLLTKVLHYKEDTENIQIKDIEDVFNKYWFGKDTSITFANVSKNELAINLIIDEANKISNVEKLEIENKIVLSMATRLLIEKYIINQIIEKVPEGNKIIEKIYTEGNQTGKLISEYKKNILYLNRTYLPILEQVGMMTPENIHLNSFMYEPILDMSLIHLYDLYNKVKQL